MKQYETLWEAADIKPIAGFRWCWWFWLFFIENKTNPERPKQLMILWSYKDAPTYIGDLLYIPEHSAQIQDTVRGAVAGWFYDGNKMNENIVLDTGALHIYQDKHNREKGRVEFALQERRYIFSGEKDSYRVIIQNENINADLRIENPNPNFYTQPIYKENRFLSGIFMYSIVKLNRCIVTGYLDGDDIVGTAYFQKVGLNNPALPWFWSVAHLDDGSVIKYFFPHISTGIFRKSSRDIQKADDNIWLPVKKEMEFYIADEEQLVTFNRYRFRKIYKPDNYPKFIAEFRNRDAQLSFTLDCYARTYFSFFPRNRRFIKPQLYYNEYPCRISTLRYRKKGEKTRTLDDFGGSGVANAEHTWGYLI